MLDYPLREAKGLRPALCIAACGALGGELGSVLQTAVVLELYHNAFLVHDDVEDRSLTRRGRPTLHVEHGEAIAINVGDGMLALTLRPLLRNIEHAGLGPALRILESMGEMAERTVEGQACELDWIRRNVWTLSEDDYVEMVVGKTGWYSFIAPVRCGALCAGFSGQALGSLECYARDLSIAFQIQDDVLSIEGSFDEFGKDDLGDLWEGKRTLILLHALRTAPAANRNRALRILSKRPGDTSLDATIGLMSELESQGRLTAASSDQIRTSLGADQVRSRNDVDELAALVRTQGSIAYARGRASTYLDRARSHLESCDGLLQDSADRDFLWGLIDFVAERRS